MGGRLLEAHFCWKLAFLASKLGDGPLLEHGPLIGFLRYSPFQKKNSLRNNISYQKQFGSRSGLALSAKIISFNLYMSKLPNDMSVTDYLIIKKLISAIRM